MPAALSLRKRSGVSWDPLLTTTIQGRRPGRAMARMMSSTSPRARGSPPEMLTTTGLSLRQMAAYSSGLRRVSLMGPPQLQCQQLAVQAWVTSNETDRGFLRHRFHAACANMRNAMLLDTFIQPPDRRDQHGRAGADARRVTRRCRELRGRAPDPASEAS